MQSINNSYNPSFRQNLLKSIERKNLLDVRLVILKDYYPRFASFKSIPDYSKVALRLLLEFSGGILLQYKGLRTGESDLRRGFEASEAIYRRGELTADRNLLVENTGIVKRELSISIATLFKLQNSDLFDLSNVVKTVSLLKETSAFQDHFQNRRWSNDVGVRGFGIEFLNGSILNIYSSYKGEEVLFHIDTDDLILKKGWLNRDHTFPKAITEIEILKENIIYLSDYPHVNNDYVGHDNKVDYHFIYPIAAYKIFDSFSHRVMEITARLKQESKAKHLLFLRQLKKDFQAQSFGIPELTFALDSHGNLKIVGPIDILPKLDENEFFLEKMIMLFS